MSCLEADTCKDFKMNIGNPYPNQSPCHFCKKNMSDFELGVAYAERKAKEELETRIKQLEDKVKQLEDNSNN